MAETIISRNSFEQYKEDMQKYAIYVSRYRVIPDYRDAMKPVHRRILYCMWQDLNAIGKKVKSSKVTGAVIGTYHPHGDAAVYGSMKPMVNWFEINKPLLSKQGSFGNFQGDGASHQRYTEAGLSKFALDCVISDLEKSKQVVDWVPTYDGTDTEPEYLPASIPLVLINGAFGIGVGVKVEIPRHNLNEVVDATIKLIDNPNASIELVPDHCMACDIIKTNFKEISNLGAGSYVVRGTIDIGEYKGKSALILRSLPDMIFLNNITDTIEELIKDNKIVQIQDMADESTEFVMEYYLVLKKGSDPNFVRDVIYKHTDMEKRFRVNFEVLDGINPLRMSYKSYLLAFIEFRKITKFRLYHNELQKVQTKIHEMEIYIKLLQSGDIDDIIYKIRHQKDIDDNALVEWLIAKLYITDLQAKFVLDIDVKKLSEGYLNKYINDTEKLTIEKQNYINKIINDDIMLMEIKEELLEHKRKYGNKRRCKIITESEASGIPQGIFKIVITENNFIKKSPVNENIGNFKNAAPKCMITVDNADNVLIFDDLGKVFKLPAHKVSFSDKSSYGTDIRLLIKNLTSNINTVISEATLRDFDSTQSKYFVVIVTRCGYIKKLDIADFLTAPPSGQTIIKLDSGDTVKDIIIIGETADIIVYSDSHALRMRVADIPHLKRSTKGSMSMANGEGVDGISVINHDTTDIIIVTENGFINRFQPSGLQVSTRGKKGNAVIKLSKGDKIKCMYGINSKDSIIVSTQNDRITIPVSDIPVGSSVSSGTKMLPMKTDNIIKCGIIKGK